jgi:hypothetical protein
LPERYTSTRGSCKFKGLIGAPPVLGLKADALATGKGAAAFAGAGLAAPRPKRLPLALPDALPALPPLPELPALPVSAPLGAPPGVLLAAPPEALALVPGLVLALAFVLVFVLELKPLTAGLVATAFTPDWLELVPD